MMQNSLMLHKFIRKVSKIAQVKYDFNEDVIEAYLEDIEDCWNKGFSPRRTVEYLANKIYKS